jgi:polyhydroxyalkanoate synthesis regulator phasin
MTTKKWKVRTVVDAHTLDETGQRLEDALNSLQEEGYDVTFMQVEKPTHGFYVIAKPTESIAAKLIEVMTGSGHGDGPAELIELSPKTKSFLSDVLSKASNDHPTTVLKEANTLVQSVLKTGNLSVEDMRKVVTDLETAVAKHEEIHKKNNSTCDHPEPTQVLALLAKLVKESMNFYVQ